MHLIIILLTTVSILTFLSGVVTFFGAKKGEKVQAFWFFMSALFAAVWTASILIFLTATPESNLNISWHVNWVFVAAILIDIFFLSYVVWNEKNGRLLTLLFAIAGAILSIIIFLKPELLYSEINLANTGNTISLNIGLFYITYIFYFCSIITAVATALLKQCLRTHSIRKRKGDFIIMVAFALSSLIIGVSEIILPIFGNWNLTWLGPLTLSAMIISYYYSILRYRSLNLSSIWLKIFSYTVLLSSVAIVYMVIFSLIFAALFRGSTPSTEVIILNFIMILIFLLLMPAMNQVYMSIRTTISGKTENHKQRSVHGKRSKEKQ